MLHDTSLQRVQDIGAEPNPSHFLADATEARDTHSLWVSRPASGLTHRGFTGLHWLSIAGRAGLPR